MIGQIFFVGIRGHIRKAALSARSIPTLFRHGMRCIQQIQEHIIIPVQPVIDEIICLLRFFSARGFQITAVLFRFHTLYPRCGRRS